MMVNSFFLVFVCGLLWISVSDGQGHDQRLKTLANDFRNIIAQNSIRKQYAVLYLSKPAATSGQVYYEPTPPHVAPAFVYPDITGDMITNNADYPYTYSALTPDYNAARFGKVLHKATTIHTEDIALKLVFPHMEKWFNSKYNANVISVYLYSYYLPCPDCTNIIQTFLTSHPTIGLYIGFSQLYGGNNEGSDPAKRQQTKQRKQNLSIMLNNHHGRLFDLGSFKPSPVGKRETSEGCFVSDANGELFLTLNFTNGEVLAFFTRKLNGTIVLADKDDNDIASRTVLADESEIISFGKYMNEGFNAKFYDGLDGLKMQTEPWNQCGVDMEVMKELPAHYSEVRIWLQIQDGSPFVCLSGRKFSHMKFDRVQLEGKSEKGLTTLSNSVLVNQFKEHKIGSEERCYKFPRLNKDFSEGFRAKYITCASYTNCTYGELYDNVTPYWTPW
ncbi:uncharacterized protein LOC123538610 [Mercenaria mercenaria]|uniref:uncharacterized protein LOC123538610 n=1 Tax=Mercenaria mercenaria TaxID=6596 RepID=UPI00234E9F82|nr:uncharacterized protein LOC123538610 [Mercenaria mercenaria]